MEENKQASQNKEATPTVGQPVKPQNKRNKLVVMGLVVVLVVVGVLLVLSRQQKKPATDKSSAQAPSQSATVNITEDGFSPAGLVIKKGTAVVWKNSDTEVHRVAANPFKTHIDLPGLDSKTNIAPNGTYVYVFNDTGTFHYHDELHASSNGSITVQ